MLYFFSTDVYKGNFFLSGHEEKKTNGLKLKK